MKINIATMFVFLFLSSVAEAKLVRYELVATKGQVNLSGKKTVDFALMLNGQIPAPTLEFTEGDEAEIVVKNRIPHEQLSIHWHGLLLPSAMDGVPYVTTPPIHSGEDYTFRFKIRQNGTYWYHSHTDVQEQKGVFGAFIIHPKKETVRADKEIVVVLSDWADENPTQILKNLRKDGDYYLYKKNTVRSWLGAIQAGSLGNYLGNEWTRMGGMDPSDVGYDAFLINGKRDSQLISANPGEKVRLRIINAAASTYFYVAVGQSPMKVISADGQDIEPVMAKELFIALAETYDVLFEVPSQKNYELKITAQDGTGSASGWIGAGEKVLAPVRPLPDMYATMDHGAHGEHAAHGAAQSGAADHSQHRQHGAGDHSQHGEPAPIPLLTVDEVKAPQITELPKTAKVHDLNLVLGGNMERYIWYINGKAIYQDRTIIINEGDLVRFTFKNETMMNHPMHLHGHFFRVLNKYGASSPLKHTVDVAPHSTRTIEFFANEPGEWMLHCHNLYHLKTGMARVVKYGAFNPAPEMVEYQKQDPHLHDHIYYNGLAEASTNHAQLRLNLNKTWDTLEARFETREYTSFDHTEGDLFYRRWLSNYFNLVLGGESFKKDQHAVAGIGYILPMLVRTNLLVDHDGKLRLDLEKKFQWTKYIFTDADVTFRDGEDVEFEVSLMFQNRWSWAAGLMLTEESLGAGVEVKF